MSWKNRIIIYIAVFIGGSTKYNSELFKTKPSVPQYNKFIILNEKDDRIIVEKGNTKELIIKTLDINNNPISHVTIQAKSDNSYLVDVIPNETVSNYSGSAKFIILRRYNGITKILFNIKGHKNMISIE